jgi:hypothetical protein
VDLAVTMQFIGPILHNLLGVSEFRHPLQILNSIRRGDGIPIRSSILRNLDP